MMCPGEHQRGYEIFEEMISMKIKPTVSTHTILLELLGNTGIN